MISVDSLLRSLFSQFDTGLDPFGGTDPEQIMAGWYGFRGADGGTPYGPFGKLYGGMVPQMAASSPFSGMGGAMAKGSSFGGFGGSR